MARDAVTPDFQRRSVVTRTEVKPATQVVRLASIDVIRITC